MFSSTSVNFGRYFFGSNLTIRLLSPTINSCLINSPLAGLKSSTHIQIPEKPKKPSSPFFKFINEHKRNILVEYPNLKLTALVKKCSEEWKSADATTKQIYENQYKAEMAIYAKKFLEYSASLTSEQKAYIQQLKQERRKNTKKRKEKKVLRQLGKPKKPLPAVLMYLLDQADATNKKYNDLLKDVKKHWEQLDESQKLPYIEKSEQAKINYFKELKDWERKMLEEGNERFVRVKTLREKRPASSRSSKSVTQKKRLLKDSIGSKKAKTSKSITTKETMERTDEK